MKKLLILALVSIAFASSSFAQISTSSNEQIPYAETFMSPCTGETISATGTMHIKSQTTINKNKLSIFMHINLQELKGVSESGAVYHGNYVEHERINEDFTGSYERTTTVRAILTTSGGGNNLVIVQDVHFKVNAEGVVTTDVSNSRIECQ